ncbi:PcfJ domain-containing protein [Curtobacterium sp. MCBD17_040]|uniref:PcfJ domain-containing protein n=1 Tax=Curtobacterium sp. MCBD17_040 TaxID=2175674 RepID=UPI000DAAAD45|nr:PcfJ domain-containing protein [Curtobacterium sp. MCBD17_040]WIB65387.1 PcfJ domain-containing protein [Curtobacterium sp. MCBD17_040]
MRKPQPTVQENSTHWVERRWYPSDYVMVIERPETVVVGYSSLTTGHTRTGQEWTRWQRNRRVVVSVRPGRSGRRILNVFTYERHGQERRFRNATPYAATVITGNEQFRQRVADAVRRLWERNIGEVPDRLRNATLPMLLVGLAYPGLAGQQRPLSLGDATQPVVPRALGIAWRADNARDVAVALFGQRRVRRDLVRAVAAADPNRAGVAHAVRSLVPVDWLVTYLERCDGTAQPWWDRRGLRSVFALVDPAARRRLLLDTKVTGAVFSPENRLIVDAMHAVGLLLNHYGENRDWVTDGIRKPKSWQSLHDEAARLERRIGHEDLPIPRTPVTVALHGLSVPDAGVRLVAPTRTATVHDWGEHMHHCIGIYAAAAAAGDTNLFGVYGENGELLANMEIAPDGYLLQLFGRFNAYLPAEQHDAIRAAIDAQLERAGIGQPMAVAA